MIFSSNLILLWCVVYFSEMLNIHLISNLYHISSVEYVYLCTCILYLNYICKCINIYVWCSDFMLIIQDYIIQLVHVCAESLMLFR